MHSSALIEPLPELKRIRPPNPTLLARQLLEILHDDSTTQGKREKILKLSVGLVNGAAAFYYTQTGEGLQVKERLLSQQVLSWSDDIDADTAEAAQQAIASQKAEIVPVKRKGGGFIVSCPVETHREKRCLCVYIMLGSASPEPFMIILQLLSLSLLQVEEAGRTAGSSSLVDELIVLSSTPSCSARELVDLLRSRSGSSMTAIATRTRKGAVKVEKVSDIVEVNTNTTPVRHMKELVAEASHRKSWLIWPGTDEFEWCEPSLLLQDFVQKSKAERGLVQLFEESGERQVAVLSLFADKEWKPDKIRELHYAAPVIGSLLQRTLDRGKEKHWLAQGFFPQSRLLAAAAVVVLLAALSMLPVTHEVTASCKVAPVSIRYITPRFNGLLKEVYVEPGDRVAIGTPLALMDDREISMELNTLAADAHKSLKEKDLSMVSGNIPAAQISQLEYEQIQQRLELLQTRKQHLRIISPIEGIVLQGDLKRSEDSPVTRGQPLFEIAPLVQLEIELAIPDDEVGYLSAGMAVEARFDAFPKRSWKGKIERISPVSEIVHDNNVFIATLTISNQGGELQPGMQGYGHVECGKKAMAWVYFHSQWYGLKRFLYSL